MILSGLFDQLLFEPRQFRYTPKFLVLRLILDWNWSKLKVWLTLSRFKSRWLANFRWLVTRTFVVIWQQWTWLLVRPCQAARSSTALRSRTWRTRSQLSEPSQTSASSRPWLIFFSSLQTLGPCRRRSTPCFTSCLARSSCCARLGLIWWSHSALRCTVRGPNECI